MNEAARRGLGATTQLRDFARASATSMRLTTSDDVKTLVERTMTAAQTVDERSQLALQLMCDAVEASSGHLYLTEGEGLTLAASYRTAAPEPSFSARLSALYQAMRAQSDAPKDQRFQLAYEDQLYEVLALRSQGEDVELVGLAALITRRAPRVSQLAGVLGALGAQVVRMKPTSGT
jgi:hypothetical protein